MYFTIKYTITKCIKFVSITVSSYSLTLLKSIYPGSLMGFGKEVIVFLRAGSFCVCTHTYSQNESVQEVNSIAFVPYAIEG